jgi:hypothetical protein
VALDGTGRPILGRVPYREVVLAEVEDSPSMGVLEYRIYIRISKLNEVLEKTRACLNPLISFATFPFESVAIQPEVLSLRPSGTYELSLQITFKIREGVEQK